MNNPFNISFGIIPPQFISRLSQTSQILDTFRSDTPSSMTYILTGVRGCGKTVLMTSISESLKREKDWITLELNPERDLLTHLAASLYAIPEFRKIFVEVGLDFSALGLGVSLENSVPVSDAEVAVDRMLSYIKKTNKRLLITIDEAANTANMRVFAASYQIFIRKNYPLYLLMTGLYENIYTLQNEKSLTFLYRAPKIILDPLNYTAIRAHYKKIFNISDDKAEKMAALTKGYSYAFQVLGFLMWEKPECSLEDILPEYDQYLEEYVYNKIWSELSDIDRKVLYAIASTGTEEVTSIRNSLNMSTEKFSVYRDRLKRKGLIDTSSYGRISLILPRFESFIKMRLA
ncbi:MAG: ATP-binding protein [Lachnospiraceae bacterium]|nr:ATP-binding protein [Lachnospiraceae bacterium]